MSDERLSVGAQSLIHAALRHEPGLDEATTTRMRERILGAVTAAAIVGVATTAGAATGTAVAAGATGAGGGTTGALVTSTALGSAAKAIALLAIVGAASGSAVLARQPAKRDSMAVVPSVLRATGNDLTPVLHDSVPVPTPAARAEPIVSSPTTFLAPQTILPLPIESTLSVRKALSAPSATRTAEYEAAQAALPLRGSNSALSTGPNRMPTADGFEQELHAIEHSTRALADGKPNEALLHLDLAGPTTIFSEERDALKAIALCTSGRRSEGARVLAQFTVSFPRSIYSGRANRACRASEVTE